MHKPIISDTIRFIIPLTGQLPDDRIIVMPKMLTIKKYPNRRLYNPQQSRYITLADVRDLVMKEVPFEVIDRQSGEDITDSILLQIIMEQETGGDPLFTTKTLSQFIRNHGDATQGMFTSFLEQSLEVFSEQQKTAWQQMQKTLDGTPLDSWLKISEQNMQTWTKVQQDIFKPFSLGSGKKD